MLMVIFSGCGCANREVKAGIDKRPETPRAMTLKAVLAILPMMDKETEYKIWWKEKHRAFKVEKNGAVMDVEARR